MPGGLDQFYLVFGLDPATVRLGRRNPNAAGGLPLLDLRCPRAREFHVQLQHPALGIEASQFAMLSLFFPRKQGDFPRKTGRRLSRNGQSLRGIRDLDNFFKSK